MLEIVKSGGILMLPIILCSILMLAIAIERSWTLSESRITPLNLVDQLLGQLKRGPLTREQIELLRTNSPLGRILACGVTNMEYSRYQMKEAMQELATAEVHRLERFMSILGTIAVISPLLGLLGTVVGMIKVFNTFMIEGATGSAIMAGGISEALVTTAAGLSVAIPAVALHRFFLRRLDSLVVTMEQSAIKLLEFSDEKRLEENS